MQQTRTSIAPNTNLMKAIKTVFMRYSWVLYKTLLITFMSITSYCASLTAQENAVKTSLKVIARPLPDSIMLRWAPSNFEGWNAGNKYGYKIIRFTLMKDGHLIKKAEPIPLTSEPVKPWNQSLWEKIMDNDDYAAVAAQAIFGETFELSNTGKTSFFEVINKVKEQNSRFSFALYAADQSPLAARASGLWFTDKNVRKGEKYLYRVFLASTPASIVADTGFVYTGIDESLPLPKPIELKADFGDKGVILHWDRKVLSSYYNAYSVERSENGTDFKRINKERIVYTQSEDFKESDELIYIDSMATNNQDYYYRVIGHTAFGENSPPSKTIKGKGMSEIRLTPEIYNGYEQNGKVIIKWVYPREAAADIKGFRIVRARSFKMKYDTISPILSPAAREFIDKKPLSTNYYKVLVYATSGKFKASVPSMVQLNDTVPPAPPTGLKAVADTTGKLVLRWKRNAESDMYGYRVYRANASYEEYSQLTVAPVRDTVFTDHINLKTLTKKIYYQVMAIDKRQNHSAFSPPLEVERPDIVPPSPPVIKSVQSTSKGVALQWIPSNSEDVAKHVILRKEKGTSVALPLKNIPINDTSSTFTDTTAILNTVYYYSVKATDRAGLSSPTTPEMAGQKTINSTIGKLEDIKYQIDRTKFTILLTWKQPAEKVDRYIIYRKEGDKTPLSVLTPIPGIKPEFLDKQLKADTQYEYLVQGVLTKGSRLISNKLTINY